MRQRRGAVAELDLLPFDEYVEQLPCKRMSAGVVLCDDRAGVLLVEPSYKSYWEIPGGVVEQGEAPWFTAVRELHEELGLRRPVGRLLVVDHVPPENDTLPERVAFLFNGGPIDPGELAGLTLGPEIVSTHLCGPGEVRAKVKPLLFDRLTAAVEAIQSGETLLCENGKRVS